MCAWRACTRHVCMFDVCVGCVLGLYVRGLYVHIDRVLAWHASRVRCMCVVSAVRVLCMRVRRVCLASVRYPCARRVCARRIGLALRGLCLYPTGVDCMCAADKLYVHGEFVLSVRYEAPGTWPPGWNRRSRRAGWASRWLVYRSSRSG